MILRAAYKLPSLRSPTIGRLYKLAFRGKLHDGKSRSAEIEKPKENVVMLETLPRNAREIGVGK